MKRYHPHLDILTTSMTKDHCLIQFVASQDLKIEAYQLFQLHVTMTQSFSPYSRIYFTGYLDKCTKMFPDCYQLNHNLQPHESDDIILPLNTLDGTFPIPTIYSSTYIKHIELFQFTLNLTIEQMAYSTAPYQVWKPIEARRGNMCFPSDQ